MNNLMDNGTVLPSGLLGSNGPEAAIAGFNRSYRNTSLKAGIVINSYAASDPLNITGLCTEYDVLVMEQYENKGSTSILYRHCLSSQGLGSLADYFEMTLRPKTFQTNPGAPTFKDQDGAIALIQCLDGVGEKAIVVGNLIHPDRQTNVTSSEPQLFAEYNGVKAQILPDGSFLVSFNGATDSKGQPTDPSQGTSTWQIKPDGSYEFANSAIDILADVGTGNLTIITKADCNIQAQGNLVATCTDATVTASGDANITSSGTTTVEGQTVLLGKNASEAVVKGTTFAKYMQTQFSCLTALGPSGPLVAPLPPNNLSTKVQTE